MSSKTHIIRLADGTKITNIECECGQLLTITSSSCTFMNCASCGRQHMNIAYYHYDEETGMLDYGGSE